jgi:hypothetical protein
MNDPRIARRAERLAYLLNMPWQHERAIFDELDGIPLDADEREDVYLANALLSAGYEITDRRWRALEALLALIPPGGDESETAFLPRGDAVRAAVCARACGWFWFVD